MSIPINGGLNVIWPALVDLRSGPYDNVAAAKAAVAVNRRAIGLMVLVAGVWYHWKAGVLDADLVVLGALPYKEYIAYLTQTGTAAPVATVIKNDFGAAVVWTRDSAGLYYGTLAAAFPSAKFFTPINKQDVDATKFYQYIRGDDNKISLGTYSSAVLADGVIANPVPIEVRVYY